MQSLNLLLPNAELVPAGHVEHCPTPVVALYVPTPHALHSAPSKPAVYPATQMQSVASMLPAPELVPAGHAEHATDPALALNVPVPHALQATPFETAVYPTTQMQSLKSLPPPAELVAKGHVKHCPGPVALLYVPATHVVHAAPSNVPLYPAMHLQSVNSLLPDSELVPAGHVEHCPVPTATLNPPASHALHATPSEVTVYPGRHSQSVNLLLPAADTECVGQTAQLPDPAVALYVPALHALHNTKVAKPDIQLAVKPLPVPELGSDMNVTHRCCFVVAYVAGAGEPLSVASRTAPDEHAASPHSSTYTKST